MNASMPNNIPTFFINGRRLIGPKGSASLSTVIGNVLAGIPANQQVQQESWLLDWPKRSIWSSHHPRDPRRRPSAWSSSANFSARSVGQSIKHSALFVSHRPHPRV